MDKELKFDGKKIPEVVYHVTTKSKLSKYKTNGDYDLTKCNSIYAVFSRESALENLENKVVVLISTEKAHDSIGFITDDKELVFNKLPKGSYCVIDGSGIGITSKVLEIFEKNLK